MIVVYCAFIFLVLSECVIYCILITAKSLSLLDDLLLRSFLWPRVHEKTKPHHYDIEGSDDLPFSSFTVVLTKGG